MPTTEEFLAHWALANGAVPGTVVVVAAEEPGGPPVTLADFEVLAAELRGAHSAVRGCLMAVSIARTRTQMTKRALLVRYEEFADRLRAFYQGSPFLTSLPVKPVELELASRFLGRMQGVATLWAQLNAAAAPGGVTLPLLLPGGYAVGDFTADVEGLGAELQALGEAEQETQLARSRRNLAQERIYAVLRNYRLTVPAVLGRNAAVTLTMPRLTVVRGSTPPEVMVSGSFVPESGQARILHGVLDLPDLTHYELRYCPPPKYRAEEETLVASHPAEAPAEFLTNHGLLTPGDRALYKVYPITSARRERGSKVVDITWVGGLP